MHYYDTSSVRAALASLLGTLTAFGLNGAVLAAGTCMEGPNLNAGQGLHWYYRVDRINHRKCWYVMERGQKTDEDPPLEPILPNDAPVLSIVFLVHSARRRSAGVGLGHATKHHNRRSVGCF